MLRFLDENRNVASGRQSHLDRMISALRLIERRQALAEAVSLDPRDRVFGRVKDGLGASKNLGCDVVFVDLV